jgi:hypothetical protein
MLAIRVQAEAESCLAGGPFRFRRWGIDEPSRPVCSAQRYGPRGKPRALSAARCGCAPVPGSATVSGSAGRPLGVGNAGVLDGCQSRLTPLPGVHAPRRQSREYCTARSAAEMMLAISGQAGGRTARFVSQVGHRRAKAPGGTGVQRSKLRCSLLVSWTRCTRSCRMKEWYVDRRRPRPALPCLPAAACWDTFKNCVDIHAESICGSITVRLAYCTHSHSQAHTHTQCRPPMASGSRISPRSLLWPGRTSGRVLGRVSEAGQAR